MLAHHVSLPLPTPHHARTSPHPGKFVASLAEEALAHRAVRHPYLEALAHDTLPDLRWALADFARHYAGYSIHFRSYLSTVIVKLVGEHRDALIENLAEESGTYGEDELAELAKLGIEREWIDGIPHPFLFRRFCAAMGVSTRIGDEADAVVCWRDGFLRLLSRGSVAESVGAIGLGTENVVRAIYTPIVSALARVPELAPRDTVFFQLHTAVDDHHNATLLGIAGDLAWTEFGRRELRRGMLAALDLRCVFWDWLYARALEPGRHR